MVSRARRQRHPMCPAKTGPDGLELQRKRGRSNSVKVGYVYIMANGRNDFIYVGSVANAALTGSGEPGLGPALRGTGGDYVTAPLWLWSGGGEAGHFVTIPADGRWNRLNRPHRAPWVWIRARRSENQWRCRTTSIFPQERWLHPAVRPPSAAMLGSRRAIKLSDSAGLITTWREGCSPNRGGRSPPGPHSPRRLVPLGAHRRCSRRSTTASIRKMKQNRIDASPGENRERAPRHCVEIAIAISPASRRATQRVRRRAAT